MLTKDILVIDDEPQMLIAMSETLKRNNWSLATASSGVQALEMLKDTQFRLVISDLRMPGVTGLDVLREVKGASPRTQVVLVTAYGTVSNAVEAMKIGAFDYLLKPFSFTDLQDVVQRAIRKNESFLSVRKARSAAPIITRNPDMLATLELAEQAAKGRATMLIQAESGTGKELMARWVHQCSLRSQGPYVAVNCAALPENLLEAELFGYEKGAFTGANNQKPGKFEMAHTGTILLDEIGEMAPVLQAKLLRVLQEQEVDRLGGRKPIPIDVRVIATTNKSLKALVREGTFREDLYYRLNVIPLTIPPLRRRKEDISMLAEHFCEKFSNENGGKRVHLAPETFEVLTRHDWPGNVRELENVIHRGSALAKNSVILPRDLFLNEESISGFREPAPASALPIAAPERIAIPETALAAPEPASPIAVMNLKAGFTMSEMEKKLIHITLEETRGNRTRAAMLLGISLRTLRNKLREYRQEQSGLRVDLPAN